MTKADLISRLAEEADLTLKDAGVVVDTFFAAITDALAAGEKTELRGFGSFRTRNRGPREGRNPRTGEKVSVPAKTVPYFRPGKSLRQLVDRADNPRP